MCEAWPAHVRIRAHAASFGFDLHCTHCNTRQVIVGPDGLTLPELTAYALPFARVHQHLEAAT